MNRIKSDFNLTGMGVENLEKADSLLKQIGDLEIQILDEQAICKSSVDAAKDALQKAVGPLQERIGLYTLALERFAESHPEVFGKKKSIALQHGLMGWHESKKTSAGANTIRLIKRFFADRVKDLIDVTEKVRIPAVKKLTQAEQMKIEVFTTITNPFFVESSIPKAVDYGNPAESA